MKKYLVILLLFITFKGKAQNTATAPVLNDKAIVKDEDGNVLATILWRAYSKTGEYSFRYQKEDNSFLIYKMTPEQKAVSDERREAMLSSSARPRPSNAFKDGDKFIGYKLTDLNGNKYDLKASQGKVIVINFWFINCPPCKQEIPELNQLFIKYKDNKDVLFLAIALDDKFDLKQFTKISPFLYNIVPDGRYFADKHGVTSYPTHLIVGKDGLIKFHTTGLAHNTVYWVDKTIKEQLATL